ncbi:MAG: PglZ domain-containing protein, partial [Acidimicrobiales bacterium]|nr:PglZ domain-containing protein [Acidimicrobiales bacterium]
ARFRWLHARTGAATDLAAAAAEAFGEVAWVRSVDQVVADGWLGPVVTGSARRRLGDVAVVPHEPVAIVDPAEHTSIHLIGRHGSLTSDEVFVPALCAVT